MSDQALQQVIQELKDRGIKAGRQEGANIVQGARDTADEILAEARSRAEKIVQEAQSKAEATKTQLDAELRHASAVGLEAFRQAVERSFLVPTLDSRIRGVLEDPTTLKLIIIETVKGFTSSGGSEADLEVILPESRKKKLEGAFMADLLEELRKGVKVGFSDGFEFGFRIAPESGAYVFDFSDGGFREIFLGFLAPRFRRYFYES